MPRTKKRRGQVPPQETPDHLVRFDGHICAGRHVLIEMSGINPKKLGDEGFLLAVLCEYAKISGASIVKEDSHPFGEGCGVSATAILSESHVAGHSWTEIVWRKVRGILTLDGYMCGPNADPCKGLPYLKRKFNPRHMKITMILRGVKRRNGPGIKIIPLRLMKRRGRFMVEKAGGRA